MGDVQLANGALQVRCSKLQIQLIFTGADPGFFLGGGALVSCSTSAPINHIVFFFLQNTSCIRKPQVISGGTGGGGAHRCTLPLDPPLLHYYRIPKDPEASGMYSSATIPLRASLTGGLLLSTMPFAVPPNDPHSPCNHQSYLFPSFRT